MTTLFLKSLLVWVVIALAETVHGIARIKFLNRRLGARLARQVGVATGSLIILAIALVSLPWIGVETVNQCFSVGLLWLVLMVAFDVGIGRLAFRMSWSRILSDFNPRKGGFLGIGMVVLFFAPWLAAHWHLIL
jgi:hypothetical protein